MPPSASSAPSDKSEAEPSPVPRSRYLVYLSIVVLGCVADLWAKSFAFSALGFPERGRWWLWKDVAGFEWSLNQGALFGMGQGFVFVFAFLSLVAAGLIVWWLFVRRAAHELLLTIALACVTAGIVGNLYDRLGLHGLKWPPGSVIGNRVVAGEPVFAVRDYILVMLGDYPWPNFNIADSFLVCGAILLVPYIWPRKAKEEARSQKPGARRQEAGGNT